jgi:succinate dehydrogenase/fumarate reductase flavoprotein subunit
MLVGGAMAAILEKYAQCSAKENAMAKERIVVVGGDAAGMSAASQARRRRPDLDIVVFERTPYTSYSN